MKVRKGDEVEILSNRVGQANRRGTVKRIVAKAPLKVEVAWEDGHTSQIGTAGGNLRVVAPH